MPQIANQDYNVIAPVRFDYIDDGYENRVPILENILRRTIFDCILKNPTSEFHKGLYRIISVYSDDGGSTIIIVANSDGATAISLFVPPTLSGLETLKVEAKIEAQLPEDISQFYEDEENQKYLVVEYGDGNDAWVTINGKCVEITIANQRVATATISNAVPPDGATVVVLDEEDLPHIVGVGLY